MPEESVSAVDAAAWRRLDPQSVHVGRLTGAIWVAAIGLASLLGFGVTWLIDPPELPIWIVLGATWVLLGLFAWLAWVLPEKRFRYTRYRLDELGLLIHRGRMFHSELGVLRSRIQHSDVSQGPIQRAYGLATLSISTAGSDEGEIGLTGIPIGEARRLRAELTGLVGDDVV